jgi:hypothetical protein
MHDMKVCILYAYVKELSDSDERDIIPEKSRQHADIRQHANLPYLEDYTFAG